MNEYIDAVCEGEPLDKPSFNEDTELWELYFEESDTPWHPYDSRDLIAVSFDSAQKAEQSYNHYSQPNQG
jgi:hypothetical protein